MSTQPTPKWREIACPGFPKGRPEVMALATAIEAETTLADQPRGAELEYRIIAINKAGDGPPSNTVMAVL